MDAFTEQVDSFHCVTSSRHVDLRAVLLSKPRTKYKPKSLQAVSQLRETVNQRL